MTGTPPSKHVRPLEPTDASTPSGLHRAYGLTWQCPLPCPEMPPAPADAPVDVVVRVGHIDRLRPSGPQSHSASPPRRRESVGVMMPGMARVRATGGREVIVDPVPDASEVMIRLAIIGAGASLILHQRGILPLHASAVVTPAGAAVFMGPSGSGKSTLLNACLRRGHGMLSEDLAAVKLAADGRAWVEPGVGVTKLWHDSARALGVATEGLSRVRPQLDKFLVPVHQAVVRDGAPIAAIYVLGRHDPQDVAIEACPAAARFNALINNTWQKLVLKNVDLHTQHFETAVALANLVPILNVRHRTGLDRLEAVVDALEADLETRRTP